jgi:hypothetical protein
MESHFYLMKSSLFTQAVTICVFQAFSHNFVTIKLDKSLVCTPEALHAREATVQRPDSCDIMLASASTSAVLLVFFLLLKNHCWFTPAHRAGFSVKKKCR